MEHYKRRHGKETIIEARSDKGGEGPIYNDTSCIVENDMAYQWGEIYQTFHRDSYPEVSNDDRDFGVYYTLKISRIYQIVAHPEVFPCAEAISWIIHRTDIDNRLIKDTEGKTIASF